MPNLVGLRTYIKWCILLVCASYKRCEWNNIGVVRPAKVPSIYFSIVLKPCLGIIGKDFPDAYKLDAGRQAINITWVIFIAIIHFRNKLQYSCCHFTFIFCAKVMCLYIYIYVCFLFTYVSLPKWLYSNTHESHEQSNPITRLLVTAGNVIMQHHDSHYGGLLKLSLQAYLLREGSTALVELARSCWHQIGSTTLKNWLNSRKFDLLKLQFWYNKRVWKWFWVCLSNKLTSEWIKWTLFLPKW